MKQTLLEITQDLLSSIDGDEVNSIFDTPESEAVARLVRQAYLNIVSELDIPQQYDFFELESSTDPTKPILMTKPENVSNILWIKYNIITAGETDTNYTEVKPKSLEEFLNMSYTLKESDTHVEKMTLTRDSNTIDILYTNDNAPRYYTTFNDETILFDSYDSSVDTTLQKTKTLSYGLISPSFTLQNNFTPDLNPRHFALLMNEAKALVWAERKQIVNEKAERTAKRQKIKFQKTNSAIKTLKEFDRLPNYGRK